MATVQYIGLDEVDIDRYTQELLKRRVQREMAYLDTYRKGNLTIHIKEYKKRSVQHKYSVHLRFDVGHVIPAHAHSWNILSAIDKCFDRLASEL